MSRVPRDQKPPTFRFAAAAKTGGYENLPVGRSRSGRAGALARMERTTSLQRKKIAKKAAAARWKVPLAHPVMR